MLLELVAICTLSTSMNVYGFSGIGSTLAPPPEWRVEKITHYGPSATLNLCAQSEMCNPAPRTVVTLRRTIQPNEPAKAPEGCEMTVEQKEKP